MRAMEARVGCLKAVHLSRRCHDDNSGDSAGTVAVLSEKLHFVAVSGAPIGGASFCFATVSAEAATAADGDVVVSVDAKSLH